MTTRITRRQALAVGMASAATCLLQLKAEADPRVARIHEDLYVFPALQSGRVMLLVTCNERRNAWTETRFHIGAATHSVRSVRFSKSASLVVPDEYVAGRPLWAERLYNGSRRRVASPFVAALIAHAPALGPLYDSSSPDSDGQNLMKPFARVIEARLRQNAFRGDARAYAIRLAAVLLPDVMRFDPARPAGFTFAARNGRHPADSHAVVVNSILNGSISDPTPLEAIHVASL